MPPRKATRSGINPGIAREIGRLAEAVENGKEDRSEMKAMIVKIADMATEVRQAVNGLNQAVQSMTTRIVALDGEKCGARLDALESKTKHYDRIIGTANTFAWKILALIVIAAVAGVSAAKLIAGIQL